MAILDAGISRRLNTLAAILGAHTSGFELSYRLLDCWKSCQLC